MAFEDFGQLSQRRRVERQEKLKKRIAIGAAALFVLLLIIAAGVVALVYKQRHGAHDKKPTPKSGASAAETKKEIAHPEKAIKSICANTDYKERCQSTLSKVMSTNNSSPDQPKDVFKAAIGLIINEVQKVANSTQLKFEKPEEKAAFEDCKVLLQDAKEELEESVTQVGGHDLKKLPSRSHDLNNWLSAVMSYQRTCIDGFPDGKLKSDIEKSLQIAKELTSNALAIVSEVASIFSKLSEPGGGTKVGRRRLLEVKSTGPSLSKDGNFPSWMNHEHRRMAEASKPKPNVVVAKDGSGNFKTISEALAAMPQKYSGRYVIYVKEGTYEETVTVTKKMVNVTIYGDGSRKTIVSGSKNFVDGVRTFQTATFVAIGDGFIAKDIGFRNTAGPEKHQAVAIRVQSDHSVFYNCRMDGYQDTLYAQTHRQFYRSCVITGTIDFIFGDAAAIFQNCMIVVRKPLDNQQNIITAQGRSDKRETTGIVIQNCRIKPDEKLVPLMSKIKSYLGRPWKEYSRTIVMETTIEDVIHPDGWLPWQGDFALKTLSYAEYNNNGAGAKLTARVKWPGYKVIKKEEAMKYSIVPFLQGQSWVTASGAPVQLGLLN